MENFNQYCNNERNFLDANYNPIEELFQYIKKLNNCFKKDSDNFAEICYWVYQVRCLFDKYKVVYSSSYKSVSYNFDTIMQGFGISKSESSRILSSYEKFITKETEKPMVLAEFYGFSKSKLFELLTVDNEQIKKDLQSKVLRFDMSVKTIREYVRNLQKLKNSQNQLETAQEENDEFNEEEIPDAYNPELHYEFAYFKAKNKAQLLNIVWEKQKAYERLEADFIKLKKERKNGKTK